MLIEANSTLNLYLPAAVAVAGGLTALAWRRRSRLLLALAVLIGGGLAVLGPMQQASRAHHVVIVRAAADGPAVDERQLQGPATVRFANGATAQLVPPPHAGRGSWVVNDTDRPVAVREVLYAAAALKIPDQPVAVIAPYSLGPTSGPVRYWGQGGHAPPATISSVAAVESRLWLTWE